MFQLVLLIVLVVVLVGSAWLQIRQGRLIRQLREESKEAAESRRLYEEEQARNRQLKQEMTSNIAHELKTPVASIRGYLEILLGDKPVADEKRRFFLDRCYSQTLRLSELINDVSLINKLEEASNYYDKEPVDVRAVADEAVGEMGDKAAGHGIAIDCNIPTRVINGSHSLIYAIFRNLLENSISHAGEGCAVVMESYKETDEMLYLHYYDTGVGVGNEYLGRIFDRFQRIDGGRSRKNGGSGLGLSIVKHAVIYHGGTIYAKNRDGGGLEFFFSLKKGM